MARKTHVLVVMGVLILFLVSISSADVPHMMSYSGNVTKVHGGPLNGTFQLTFSIYPDTSGSPADWTETQPEVAVKHGMFSVLLGSVNPIPASTFDGGIKYLGVQVESDPEMRPLTPIVSVAYAYRAGSADVNCEDCDDRFVNAEGPDSVLTTGLTGFQAKTSGNSEFNMHGIKASADNASTGVAAGGHFYTSSSGTGNSMSCTSMAT